MRGEERGDAGDEVGGKLTVAAPLRAPVTLPAQSQIPMKSSRGSLWFGLFVVLLTCLLYVVFW